MALLKWTTGDTITERSANNKGIRKGTEAEIAAIVLADRENGDHLWNSNTKFPQVQLDATNDYRGNVTCAPIGADGTEVSVTGTTPTEKKNLSFIKNTNGLKGNSLTIVAEIKTNDNGTTAHLRVRIDGSGSDSLDLTTTSTSYEIKSGTIDISGLSAGRHTLEFYLDDGSGDTVSLRELEVYGI